ncbi:hypothetical protein K4039_21920 [Lyngbya sp. CCAP 1446/10]|nr:hypothetical protein [Lyngbya sp. CCAP 1446/10]MCW6052660.1 hypothetical protein [Lyngbya sp. CCAP 1446/10]
MKIEVPSKKSQYLLRCDRISGFNSRLPGIADDAVTRCFAVATRSI